VDDPWPEESRGVVVSLIIVIAGIRFTGIRPSRYGRPHGSAALGGSGIRSSAFSSSIVTKGLFRSTKLSAAGLDDHDSRWRNDLASHGAEGIRRC
jgi:hypothetical protein